MNDSKLNFNTMSFHVLTRRFLISFIISIFSLFWVLFSMNFGLTGLFMIDLTFQALSIINTIIILLFLPTYPIFFMILKPKGYTFLERLSFTIMSNMTFYILTGYVGGILGVPLNGFLFLLTVMSCFFILSLYIIIQEIKNGKYKFLKSTSYFKGNMLDARDFSILKLIKDNVSLNSFLLLTFIFLTCIVNIISFSYFYGTDAWLHITIIKLITEMNFLPIEEYYGTLGLHVFGASLQFFSNIDVILLPRYFIFYTYFVSALILYNLLLRISKNKNLAIFGVFIAVFANIGFSHAMVQFWPSSLALMQGLLIFHVLYIRLEGFVTTERPNKEELRFNIVFIYIFITFLFVGLVFTHSLTAIILLLSYLFVFFIYFFKDWKRGIDFTYILALTAIFMFIYLTTNISGHFWFLSSLFSLPWYFLVGGLVGGAVFIGILGLRLRNTIHYDSELFNLVLSGEKYSYYKKIEDKFIIPLAFGTILFFTALLLVLVIFLLNINLLVIFIGLQFLLYGIFGGWGFIIFQKKTRGKIVFIWMIFYALSLAVIFFYEYFAGYTGLSGRILIMASPVIVIGFVMYIYKLMKLKSITSKKTKLFIISIILFSLFASFMDTYVNHTEFNVKKKEASAINIYSSFTSDKNYIIGKFGRDYIFRYFNYPYSLNNYSIQSNEIHYQNKDDVKYFYPDNHFDENGTNLLRKLKEEHSTDVYIILDDVFLQGEGWELYGRLTYKHLERYYNLQYLNKISSSKSQDGTEIPFYWVI